MATFDHLLVALDFRSQTSVVLDHARQLAGQLNAKVTLLHVIEYTPYNDPAAAVLLHQRVNAQLELFTTALSESGVDCAQPLTITGRPVDTILEIANSQQFDAVVLGSNHEPNGMIGSSAERVIRHAKHPVLIVQTDRAPEPFHRVFCATDGTPASSKTLSHAIDVCRQLDGTFTAVHVLPDLIPYPGFDADTAQSVLIGSYDPTTFGTGVGEPAFDPYRTALQNRFANYIREFDFDGVAYNELLLNGDPAVQIPHAAKDKCDLLVIGTHSGNTILHLGGTAEKIVRHPPCSLLIIPHQDEK